MPELTERNPNPLVNQTEAAGIIGVSRPTIPAMVARGELEGTTISGRVYVTRASAERAAEERRRKLAVAS